MKQYNGAAKPSMLDEAAAKKPTFLANVIIGCIAICAVMGTIKLGLVLFT